MAETAFLFPGQGAQKPGMGLAFAQEFEEAAQLFEKADDLLGFSLSSLCFEGPEDELKLTENAQPALYTTSIAAWKCLQKVCPVSQGAAAGHSVGEYAALTAAGALSFEQGLLLVRKRGELMRDAARQSPGVMAALLGIEAETAREICRDVRSTGAGVAAVANINGGGQIVVSGTAEAVQKAGELARERGAKRVIPLNVSGAFHSPLMVTAGDALYPFLAEARLAKPKLKVVANITADYIEDPQDVVGGLTRQVSGSVLWEDSMQRLLNDGYNTFIELGTGETLTGLMRRINKQARAAAVQQPADLQAACQLIQEAGG